MPHHTRHPLRCVRRLLLPALLLLAGCGGGGNSGATANAWTISATATALPATAAPVTGGSVQGTGPHADGASVTLVAVPAPGFAFAGWEENGATVATTARYTFTASADRDLTARFRVEHPFVDQMLDRLDTATIAAADFNGDGHADDLVADRIWLNNGRGGFYLGPNASPLLPYNGIPSIPFDADGDGDDDLLTLGDSPTLFRNMGNGRLASVPDAFGASPPLTSAGIPAAGDLDSDGDLDLMMATGSGTADVWVNDGKGHFSPGQDLGALDSPGPSMTQFTLADLDGDGDLDVIFAPGPPSNSALIWFNDGRGAFSASTATLPPLLDPTRVTAADLDGDSAPDLIFGHMNEEAAIWFNDGQGGFTAGGSGSNPIAYNAWNMPAHGPVGRGGIAAGDVDGDGDVDLVIGTREDVPRGSPSATNQVWLNNGAGRFTPGQRLETSHTFAVTLADLDRDGDLDIATANGCLPSGCPLPIRNRIWLNDGQANFSEPVSQHRLSLVTNPSRVVHAAVGDIDGDGNLDLVMGNDGYTITLLNNGRGKLTPKPGSPLQRSDGGLALGDLDGDGDPDLVLANPIANGGTSILINDGAGNFTTSHSLAPDSTRNLILADIDGDDDQDLLEFTGAASLSGTEANRMKIWTNNGQGGFTLASSLDWGTTRTTGTAAQRAVTADVDGDGDLDVIAANQDGSALFLAENTGNGRFLSHRLLLPGPNATTGPVSLRIADFDNDGDPDLAAGYGNVGGAYLWFNDGAGYFTSGGQSLGHGEVTALAVADLDGDGDPDLVTSGSDTAHVWLNDGNGHLTRAGDHRHPDTDANTRNTDALLFDLDSNGSPELITIGPLNARNDGVRVYRNAIAP